MLRTRDQRETFLQWIFVILISIGFSYFLGIIINKMFGITGIISATITATIIMAFGFGVNYWIEKGED